MSKVIVVSMSILFVLLCACSHKNVVQPDVYKLKDDWPNAVISQPIVDVFEGPSILTKRHTQALLGQPVRSISSQDVFFQITLENGIIGYVQKTKLIEDTSSLMTNTLDQKILVTGKLKVIYANPDGRIPLEEAVMGTVLTYLGKSGDWVKVQLPDGTSGYLTINNIILYEGIIPDTDSVSFIRDLISFDGVKYLPGGSSELEGFDMINLVFICAKINGKTIKLDMNDLMDGSTEVGIDNMIPGDILLLSKDRYNDNIDSLAVLIDTGQVMMFSEADLKIGINRMPDHDVMNRVRKVIRIFKESE